MKIAFLAYSDQQIFFLRGMRDKCEEYGHLANLFYSVGGHDKYYEKQISWENWEFGDLLNYDRLVVFNGYAKETFAQTEFLKKHFGNRMIFCERAWLPQSSNIYFDSCGLGGRSFLSKLDLGYFTVDHMTDIGSKYTFSEDTFSDDNFILIPLQLEHDTSIILDSPYFKTMNSLIMFVKKHFSDYRIIVRPHPLQENIKHIEGVTYETSVKTINLAKSARAIIGINSTSIVESLQFYKPCMMFGYSVLSGTKDIFLEGNLVNPRKILDFHPNSLKINSALSSLYSNQIDFKTPKMSPFLV